MSAIIQVWSAPSCQPGAQCLGAVAPWLSAQGSEATGTPANLRVVMTREVADAAGIAEGRCLRVLSQSRGEQWWFVGTVSDSDGDAGLVDVTAGPLGQLLTVRGLVRSGGTFTFTPGRRTVAELLTTYVLTNLTEDGLTWLSLGAIDATDTIEIGTLDRATRASVLDAIESQTGLTARLRAVTSGGTLTGFAIDVVSNIAAATETVMLSVGAQATQLQRTRDALRAATVVSPFSVSGVPMEQTAWVVASTSGTAPAWVLLRDPVSGNPWPIQQDDQLVGAFVQRLDGTQWEIIDSRASDSAVQVATLGTLATGDEVTFVRSTSGSPVVELTSPADLAGARGRLFGTVATRATSVRRNYVRTPTFSTWTTPSAPSTWTSVGGLVVGEYPRNTPSTLSTLVTDGAQTPGSTTLTVRGAPANARFYAGELLGYTGSGGAQTFTVAGTVTIADGTGRASIPGVSGIIGAVADGVTVTFGAQRPTTFPAEGVSSAVARFLTTGSASTGLQSAPALIRMDGAASLTVNAAAGLTFANPTTGSIAGASLPTLAIRNTTASTTLASASSPALDASATAHTVLTCSTTIASNTTVAALVNAGTYGATLFQAIRWVSLWIGGGDTLGPLVGSGSNVLWHRAQDVLASSAAGTRYVLRGVDLERLEAENGALALGQRVRLRSDLLAIDATVKIVKLDYDLSGPEVLSLELGAIQPRLTGVTVTL